MAKRETSKNEYISGPSKHYDLPVYNYNDAMFFGVGQSVIIDGGILVQ